MSKDYRINIKVRNNRLIEAIEESGGQLGGKWCKANNLSYNKVNDLIRLKDSPLKKNQVDLTETAYKLCEILNKSPNELWSDEQINPLQMNDVSVQEVMEEMTEREQMLLRMRYYENMTFEEIAQEFDLSVERVRQIEARTFRKLRQPKRLGDIHEDLLGGLS